MAQARDAVWAVFSGGAPEGGGTDVRFVCHTRNGVYPSGHDRASRKAMATGFSHSSPYASRTRGLYVAEFPANATSPPRVTDMRLRERRALS
jgi:hypothetical protein